MALAALDPFAIFADWFAAAKQAEPINPEAMSLATLSPNGMPQARTVLLKSFSAAGFVFYTNAESRKGQALQHTARAALLLYWRQIKRQISAEGEIRQLSAEETLPYFQSRPRDSRINALASQQSQPLKNFSDLDDAVAAANRAHPRDDVPLPPTWRGYCLSPLRLEFWQEGSFRLHRRLEFCRTTTNSAWQTAFLQP